MNENKNPVAAGVYNCRLVSASRSKRKGNENHFILSLRIIPQESGVESPCEYFAELPLVYASNVECGFYDKDTNSNIKRKATTADTTNAIQYAKKCIPEWAEFIESLPDDSPFSAAFEWFNDIPDGVIVRANVKAPRDYNGNTYYEATIYERGGSGTGAVSDAKDFMSAFGKSLKAAGFKVGGGSASAPKSEAVRKPTSAPKPPTPSASKSAKTSGKAYTHEDAWETYQKFCLANDPNGANYWPQVEKITGKVAAQWQTFTSEDWRKCIESFCQPF